jgi:hypothetical protein
VPSTCAFCLARDYERGPAIAVVAGGGGATVAGGGAAAVGGGGAVGPLGVVLGVVAAGFDGGVRYTGVPSPISAPSSSDVGCPAPRYVGVFPPNIEPLPNASAHLRRR